MGLHNFPFTSEVWITREFTKTSSPAVQNSLGIGLLRSAGIFPVGHEATLTSGILMDRKRTALPDKASISQNAIRQPRASTAQATDIGPKPGPAAAANPYSDMA